VVVLRLGAVVVVLRPEAPVAVVGVVSTGNPGSGMVVELVVVTTESGDGLEPAGVRAGLKLDVPFAGGSESPLAKAATGTRMITPTSVAPSA
jgi:hypothetical protein